MEKNTFYLIEIMDNNTGKCAAYVRAVRNNYNLVGLFTPAKGFTLVSVNACDTKKQAQEIADTWNQAYKDKGLYLYA